ncbi:MAG: bifunctional oligoribonuclease/PAP phosphatase NrnA [wastewater metagenome]|nr:bifunctional oligoribonuclease/PAP phosphatase NrnA [Candidatus Loosdrechtia aerotolerans]
MFMQDSNRKKYSKDIYDSIKRNDHFLITTHIRSDGDGIGAEVALYHTLRNMGKSVHIVNDSLIPRVFKFLIPDKGVYIYPQLPSERASVVFTLDCPTLDRVGRVREVVIPEDALIINIDHHISNEYFGKINWVDADMCSTGEIVVSLLREMNTDITPDIATALYVAIMTDTGRFTHANTTSSALSTAAFLIDHGARHGEISRNVYRANSFNLVRLHAQVLNTVQLHLGNRVATIWLTKDMLEKAGVDAIDAQEFADIPISIDGVSVGMLLRDLREPNWVKVSLRSRNGFDVNTIAKKFGGGGHTYAAGCEIQGSVAEVQQIILKELEEALVSKK